MTRAFALALLAIMALLFTGCRGCSRDRHIAEVTQPRGDVRRDTTSSLQKWEPAPAGAKLALGDGLRTGAGSGAAVSLAGGGTIAVASETTIRFLATAPGSVKPKLAVEAGEATIEADQAVVVETSIGLAHVEAGGKLRVSAEGGTTRFEVTVGAARIDTDDGGVALSPGRSFEVSLGGAIVEREAAGAAADAGKPIEVAAPPNDAGAGAGQLAVDVHGAGVRRQARGASTWQPLAEGAAEVSPGDAIEVPPGASVDVRRGARRARLVGQGRYLIGESEGGALVRASSGRVELEATSEDVAVEVPGGAVVARTAGADGKSRVTADVRTNDTRVTVRQGQSEVRGKGPPETVRAGEIATLSSKGVVSVATRAPERADFTIRAGESVIVRDPRPPTALGFDFSSVCPGAAVVSRGGEASVRAERRAAMFMPAGQHAYTVRCVGPDGVEEKPASSGTVTIIADSARAELARLPPSTVVDTDGRPYTVLYQNSLPSVVARWPDGPAGKASALHVDAQSFKTDGPRHALKSGTVSEGTHVLWFETQDHARRSADTTLVIKFDNAAPAASVREPADGSFQPGDTVNVAGVVVEGWSVSVNGQAVALDDQRRFSTTATVPAGENAIVLRMSHPKRGTVHYVRHAGAR